MKHVLHILKNILIWIFASFITVIIGVTAQTQFVLSRLPELGADISLIERLSMTVYDLRYLGQTYGFFIFIALGLSFLIAGLIFQLVKFGRAFIYALAGGAAVFVLLFTIKAKFFNIHILAGARDFSGLTLQVIAGILGGLLFAHLSRKLISHKKSPANNEAL